MSEALKFRISSALKDIIGRDLITDDFIAVFELVKNSYDAHAKKVDLVFEHLDNPSLSRIIIKDDGKGMNYDDLKDKWLFVAYSAKKEGTEDDYRDKINKNFIYAGAKGIGRFSCDRLGKSLRIETTKRNNRTEILETYWEDFEKSLRDEFVDVEIDHSWKKENTYGIKNGTVLEISNLRSEWDRIKLLKLKGALAKLINPSRGINERKFVINIIAEDEREFDKKETESYKIVNGEVENLIFRTLEVKTSKIISTVSEDGKFITTELRDGGTLIYTIKEKNQFYLLNNLSCSLYYLNQSAKSTFTRRMGIAPINYGHVFLYKNGFRIYPYGEPGEDPLRIDQRKSQGYGRYIGTRELIGQIEIFGDNNELKETSSRGDGLIKTNTLSQLENFFEETLKRLERYVVDVQQWGVSMDEDSSIDRKSLIGNILAKITGSKDIIEIKYDDAFLEILENSQSDSAETIVKNLNRIALDTGNMEIEGEAKRALKVLEKIQKARVLAEKRAEEEIRKASSIKSELEEKISENLFLKSINTQEYEDIINMLHHIGIASSIIDSYLKGITYRISNDIEIKHKELKEVVGSISSEVHKIISITRFATKAKFKLQAQPIKMDLPTFIAEYISNIARPYLVGDISIKIDNSVKKEFAKQFTPIEMSILIDNLINNSKKAQSKNISFLLSEIDQGKGLEMKIIDNGVGIEKESIPKIFEYGYTTTEGSGLGLNHVRKIVEKLDGSIDAFSIPGEGTTFTIRIKK